MDEKVKQKDAPQSEKPETELDEGLEESFPASDPPAAVQPGHDPDHAQNNEEGR